MIFCSIRPAPFFAPALLLFAFPPLTASAQTDNHAPQCEAKVIDLSTLPDYVGLEDFTIDAVNAAPACKDEDGDALVLTEVSSNALISGSATTIRLTQTVNSGESVTVNFTVSDGNGGTANSSITVTR